MTTLLLGLLLFLGIHSVSIVSPAWRNARATQLGEGAWKGIYTAVSVIGFVLIVVGYGQARLSPLMLWHPPAGMRHAALLLMVPVFPLLFAAYLPGRLKDVTKHPMLVAVKFWALAHLLANGSAHDVVLFGSFLAWAVMDRISLKRRAVIRPVPGAPRSKWNDLIAIVGGLIVYGLVVTRLHLWLIGVSPLPMHA